MFIIHKPRGEACEDFDRGVQYGGDAQQLFAASVPGIVYLAVYP